VALSRRAALRRRRSMAGRHSIQIAGAVGGLTATTAEDAPAAAPLVGRFDGSNRMLSKLNCKDVAATQGLTRNP
jgi:hypothetical protein